jgi:hypothetical protein
VLVKVAFALIFEDRRETVMVIVEADLCLLPRAPRSTISSTALHNSTIQDAGINVPESRVHSIVRCTFHEGVDILVLGFGKSIGR